jgi:hypothetical protein
MSENKTPMEKIVMTQFVGKLILIPAEIPKKKQVATLKK